MVAGRCWFIDMLFKELELLALLAQGFGAAAGGKKRTSKSSRCQRSCPMPRLPSDAGGLAGAFTVGQAAEGVVRAAEALLRGELGAVVRRTPSAHFGSLCCTTSSTHVRKSQTDQFTLGLSSGRLEPDAAEPRRDGVQGGAQPARLER